MNKVWLFSIFLFMAFLPSCIAQTSSTKTNPENKEVVAAAAHPSPNTKHLETVSQLPTTNNSELSVTTESNNSSATPPSDTPSTPPSDTQSANKANIDNLVMMLYDKEPSKVNYAITSLLNLKTAEAYAKLKEILAETKIRSLTLALLTNMGISAHTEFIPSIQPFVNNEDAEVREKAIIALFELKDDTILDRTKNILLDPEKAAQNRVQVAQIWSKLAYPEFVPYLIEGLDSQNQDVVQACGDALRNITKQSFNNGKQEWATWYEANRYRTKAQWYADVIENLRTQNKKLIQENTQFKDKIANYIIDYLKNRANLDDPTLLISSMNEQFDKVKLYSIKELQRLARESKLNETQISDIFSQLEKMDVTIFSVDIKMAVIDLLGMINTARANPILIGFLDDLDPTVIAKSISVLANLKNTDFTPRLENFIKTGTQNIRIAAIEAMGTLQLTDYIPLLSQLLEDNDPKIRETTARTLGVLEDPSAIDVLSKALLNDKSERVRWYAADSLGLIGDKRAVAVLLTALKNDDNIGVKESVIDALEKIKDISVIKSLEEVYLGTEPTLSTHAWRSMLSLATNNTSLLKRISDKAYENKKYEQALEGYKQLLKTYDATEENEENIKTTQLRILGIANEIKDYPTASSILAILVKEEPDNLLYRQNYIDILVESGSYDQAFTQLAEIQSKYLMSDNTIWQNRVDILSKMYDKEIFDKVIEVIDNLQTKYPDLGSEVIKSELLKMRKNAAQKSQTSNP